MNWLGRNERGAGIGSRQLVERDLIERDREGNLARRGHQRAETDLTLISDLGEDRAGGGDNIELIDEQQREPITHTQLDGLEWLRAAVRPVGIRSNPCD